MAARGPTFLATRPSGSLDRRRRRQLAWAARALLVAVAFGLGVAVGAALDDNPEPGVTRTSVQTIRPLTLPAETVTVTATAP